jgi:hypothetical protein
VLNVDLTTRKSGKKIDLGVVEQVVVLALETGVGLLLDLENDVSGFDARQLVTLAAELNAVAGLDTAVDVDVEDLSLDDGLLSVALLASVAVTDDLSLTLAVGADGLETLDHRTHLAHHVLHTAAVTASALLDSTFLSTTAIALGANDRLLQCKLGDLALVDVFERNLVDVGDCACLLRALLAHAAAEHTTKGTAAAAKELCEEVLGCHTASTTTLLETLLAKLVV